MQALPVATLADEFLADLEEEELQEEKEKIKEVEAEQNSVTNFDICSLKTISKLLFDNRINRLKENISKFLENLKENDGIEENQFKQNAMIEREELIGRGDEMSDTSSSYSLIVECNSITAEIGEEITRIHKFVRDLYAKKFHELESLVVNPLDYVKVVKRIGNSAKVSDVDLNDLLPGSTVMVIKMSATNSTSSNIQLEENDIDKLNEACDGVTKLDADRTEFLAFVESRMTFIAPNLSKLVGSAIAAKLIGVAGGLLALSRLPASTIQILGSDKKTLEGFSTAATVKKHVGFIYDCELIQNCPPSLRKKAVRVLAGKAALAARVDGYDNQKSSTSGDNLREEIEKKIGKWQERPPAKQVKALPAPDDKIRPTRGGVRVRKMKARFEISEYRKNANRISFAGEEETYGNTSQGFGMLGAANQVKLHIVRDKKLQKQLHQQQQQQQQILNKKMRLRTNAGGTATSLASSLVFTAVQGMELVDPEAAAKRVQQANLKYFGNSSFKFANNADTKMEPEKQ